MEASEVEVRCANCVIDETCGVWVVPDWDDVCYAGRAVFVAIDDASGAATPPARIAEAVFTHARDWLAAQSPDLPGFPASKFAALAGAF